MNLRLFCIPFTLMLALLHSQLGFAVPVPPTISKSLPNGIRIVIQEDHSIPTVGVSLKFRTDRAEPSVTAMNCLIGNVLFSSAEKKGLKPPFENTMMIGSSSDSDSLEIKAEITKLNAVLVLTELPKIFKNVAFDSETLARAIAAWKEGGGEEEDQQAHLDLLAKQAFNDPFYRIGSQHSPAAWKKTSPSDIKEYFDGNFTADNLVMTIVGDVDPKVLEKAIVKAWSDFPASKSPKEGNPSAAPFRKPIREEKDVLLQDEKVLLVGAAVPPSNHNDAAVLDLIMHLMNAEGQGYLDKALVDAKLVKSLSVSYQGELRSRLFTFYMTLDKDAKIDPVLKALRENLGAMTGEKITAEMVEKARERLFVSFGGFTTSNVQLASALSTNEIMDNSYLSHYGMYEEYQKVTHEDIQRVLFRYFIMVPDRHILVLTKKAKSI